LFFILGAGEVDHFALNHPFEFDPTYGYDEARLRNVPAPEGPRDFADFWRRTYAEARALPLNVARRRVRGSKPGFDVYEIEFDTLGNFRTGGWLTVPTEGPIEHGVVVGHGYGGRGEPAFEPGAVALAPCARGFDRSRRSDIPSEAAGHVVHGIESRETYVIRGCVSELWSAATVLLELYPEVRGRLHYLGVSFGGGLGALALPWDDRFRKAALEVPTFGNHPLRLQMRCNGSGEAVRAYHQRHPEVAEVLAYFDAATAARQITIPVLAACARFDPAVPPPGQFAVYNGLAGPKELFVLPYGHFEYRGLAQTARELERRIYAWWRT
jgi:cephalosporin-C deacetylase